MKFKVGDKVSYMSGSRRFRVDTMNPLNYGFGGLLTKQKFSLNIKKIQYNAKNGITTMIFEDDDIVMVKKAKDVEHCPYTAMTACIAKYIVGSQRKLQQLADKTEVIKKEE